MKIAVVGATGLVGSLMLKVLEERNIKTDKLIPVASDKSVGKKVVFQQSEHDVISLQQAVDERPDITLFSAGSGVSLEWAPRFADTGAYVIDNSSAWRMEPEIPLIVPEINSGELSVDKKIIANPNCSTIQLVMVLSPLHKRYGLKRVIISTYQSVTGSGIRAVKQLENERNGNEGEKFYPHKIDLNCLPHCDDFRDFGYTKEEWKLVNETKKILTDNSLKITATCVRVPVKGGHSESVNIEFEKDYKIGDVADILDLTPGVKVEDNPLVNSYPMPLHAEGKDDVFVGRIRRDFSAKNAINLWIVSDNLRKGAATNAVQIAEYLIKNIL